jgi:hypothetical protein
MRFLLKIALVLSIFSGCGSPNQLMISDSKSIPAIGKLRVNSLTRFYYLFPNSPKQGSSEFCQLSEGSYDLGFKAWIIDGHYLVRFSRDIPGCESNSGFIKLESDVNLPGEVIVPLTKDESIVPRPEHMSGVTTRSVAFYKQRENYDRVKARVLDWFGSTVNGCVLFATNSLRLSGTNIPVTYQIEGDAITLTTKPFIRHMLENLKWTKIEDIDAFEPGDIGVTIDAVGYPTYPSHVYTFMGWQDKSKRIAYVNDNQGFMKLRFIDGGATDDKTQYAVRPPR